VYVVKGDDSQQPQGAVIVIDHFINGRSLNESIHMFPGIMERAFQRRASLRLPFLSKGIHLLGLYRAGNIEAVLQEIIGTDKKILDCSYATATGTKVGLPVATVSKHPLFRIFTNYNGIGARSQKGGKFATRLLSTSALTMDRSKYHQIKEGCRQSAALGDVRTTRSVAMLQQLTSSPVRALSPQHRGTLTLSPEYTCADRV
jgi:hypothetical protein